MTNVFKSIAKLALAHLPQKVASEVIAEVRLESRGWTRDAKMFPGRNWAPSLDDSMILGIEANTFYPEKEALWLVGDRDNAADGFTGNDGAAEKQESK